MVPALAVADALRESGAEVTFVGTAERSEAELVPAAGYELETLKLRGLDRKSPLRAVSALGLAAAATFKARRVLKGLAADAVIGGGGYVSGPVGIAASSLRIPLILTEADSRLGLANRMLAPLARRVCLAFAISGREGDKYLVTGRPVPAATGRVDEGEARRELGIGEEESVVLVFGGSIGARSINEAAVDAFSRESDDAGRPLRVIHVCGSRDYEMLKERVEKKGLERYRLMDFVSPGFSTLLAASDLVIGRAGGSVFELAAAGKPALLVPYPHATADHQVRNAQWMVDGGAAVVVADEELTPERLFQEAMQLLSDREKLARMAMSARSLARPDAAVRVAGEALAAAGSERWHGRRLHFIGIGGAGMSGLAAIADKLGAEVTGSDSSESEYMEMLRGQGIEPAVGHDRANVPDVGEVVVSTAIPDDNLELVEARERGLPVLHRSELLGELTRMRPCIAVAGTHGKTTTAGMIAHCLEACGLKPGYVIGGKLPGLKGNAALGEGWIVVEADESDRSFLRLDPDIVVITNVELDHHSTYASSLDFVEAFKEFLARVPEDGTAVLPESSRLSDLVPEGRHVATYSIAGGRGSGDDHPGEAGLEAVNVTVDGLGSTFDLRRGSKKVASVKLNVPGVHNVMNSLGALAASELAGASLRKASKSLASFEPLGRRFEPMGDCKGAEVFDDYAHHPSEVSATLEAARGLTKGCLVAVFQPHLYSRTLHLARAFGRALAAADVVVVCDVYPARERPEGELEGVTGKLVADAAADASGGRPVYWVPELERAADLLRDLVGEGDVVVTLGAGDVNKVAERLVASD